MPFYKIFNDEAHHRIQQQITKNPSTKTKQRFLISFCDEKSILDTIYNGFWLYRINIPQNIKVREANHIYTSTQVILCDFYRLDQVATLKLFDIQPHLNYLLEWAIRFSLKEIVLYLLDQNVDAKYINKHSMSMLSICSLYSTYEIFLILIERGATISPSYEELIFATKSIKVDIIKYIIDFCVKNAKIDNAFIQAYNRSQFKAYTNPLLVNLFIDNSDCINAFITK